MRTECFIGALLLFGVSQLLLADVQEPSSYRTENYNSEVPATLTGATRVSALEVYQLIRDESAVAIDVLPEKRKPEDLPDNQIWFPVDHEGISGAVWLPDVGYGELSTVTEKYFMTHLQMASRANPEHPLVFYCRMNCWMSWNAAKRAVENGYSRVYWFANGIEGWTSAGFATEILTPAIGLRQAVR